MDKLRVRHLVKPGRYDPRSDLDLTYEIDPYKREVLSSILEDELEDSLNELERTLKKHSSDLDV